MKNLTILTLTLALALGLTSCATYTYQPEDARLATSLVSSGYIQASPNKAQALDQVKAGVIVLSATDLTPENFTLILQQRLPDNESKALFVTDLSAIYRRFAPRIQTPDQFKPTIDNIKLGLADSLVPFQ